MGSPAHRPVAACLAEQVTLAVSSFTHLSLVPVAPTAATNRLCRPCTVSAHLHRFRASTNAVASAASATAAPTAIAARVPPRPLPIETAMPVVGRTSTPTVAQWSLTCATVTTSLWKMDAARPASTLATSKTWNSEVQRRGDAHE